MRTSIGYPWARPLRRARVALLLPALAAALSSVALASPSAPVVPFASRLLPTEPGVHATRGAFAAVGWGPAAALDNPATQSREPVPLRLSASHLAWSEGVSRDWAGLEWCARGFAGTVDVGMLRPPDLMAYDAEGGEAGTFRPSEWNGGSSVSAALGRGFRAGVGGRLFRLDDPEKPVSAWTASAGVTFRYGGTDIGVSVLDLGPPLESNAGRWEQPSRWVAGGARQLGGGRVTIGGSYVSRLDGEDSSAALGVVVRPLPRLEMLGGMEHARTADASGLGWSAGAAWRQDPLRISYAVSDVAALGFTHQFGAGFVLAR